MQFRPNVSNWPIAPFRFDPEFGRYRGIADDGPELPPASPVANDPKPTRAAEQWRAAKTRRLLPAASHVTI
jgi:hypothetical protein